MSSEPLVVTGMGVVSALGLDLESLFAGVLEGRCGGREILGLETRRTDRVQAAAVDRDAVKARLGAAEQETTWPAAMAIVAARAALEDAGLPPTLGDAYLIAGCSIGAPSELESHVALRAEENLTAAVAMTRCATGAVIAELACALGARAEVHCITTTCAAGNYCLGAALDALHEGRCNRVLVRAVDSAARRSIQLWPKAR